MAQNEVVLNGEVSLDIQLDGSAEHILQIKGDDGYSPTVSVTKTENGYDITITDVNGEHSFSLVNGDDGQDYILTQQDKVDIAGLVDVPVSDVQIDGTSVLQNGVANFERPIWPKYGVVKVSGDYGISVNVNGVIFLQGASDSDIKAGTNIYKTSLINKQHASVFYGLAKAAGDTTQSQSANAVGTYTPEALTAIQQMFGVYQAPFRTIKEITITEETTNTVYVNSDSDGNAFALKEVLVFLDAMVSTGNGAGWILANNGSGSIRSDVGLLSIDVVYYTSPKTIVAHMWVSGGRFFGDSIRDITSGYSRHNKVSNKQAMGFIECSSINDITIHSANGYKFTSGTITIIGR